AEVDVLGADRGHADAGDHALDVVPFAAGRDTLDLSEGHDAGVEDRTGAKGRHAVADVDPDDVHAGVDGADQPVEFAGGRGAVGVDADVFDRRLGDEIAQRAVDLHGFKRLHDAGGPDGETVEPAVER